MSTTPTPNPNPQQPPAQQPPAQQPPVPTNPNEMSPQQVRDLAAGIPQQAPVQQPPAQAAPIQQIPGLPPIERGTDGKLSMRLPTGQVYKGDSVTDIFTAVTQAQINASQRITELGQTNQRLQQGIAAVTGQPVQGPDGQTVQPEAQFDRATYMELQSVDPILAANYLDQHRFGLNRIDDVVPYYKRTFAAGDRFSTAETVNNFRILAPDFPGTQQAVDAVMEFRARNNIPFTAENLKLIHDGMLKAGKYQPLQLQPQVPQVQIPGMPPMPIQQPTPLAQPANYDPAPQGNYSFGPGGFGTAYENPAAPVPQPPQVPVPQAPQMPVPQAGYPSIPQVQQVTPMPMPQVTPQQNVQPGGQMTEAQINQMSTADLRNYIESNLNR